MRFKPEESRLENALRKTFNPITSALGPSLIKCIIDEFGTPVKALHEVLQVALVVCNSLPMKSSPDTFPKDVDATYISNLDQGVNSSDRCFGWCSIKTFFDLLRQERQSMPRQLEALIQLGLAGYGGIGRGLRGRRERYTRNVGRGRDIDL